MTDLEIFIGFAKLLGAQIYQVNTAEFTYVQFADSDVELKGLRDTLLSSRGYDDIEFIAKFTLDGHLLMGHVQAHIFDDTGNYKELYREYDAAQQNKKED